MFPDGHKPAQGRILDMAVPPQNKGASLSTPAPQHSVQHDSCACHALASHSLAEPTFLLVHSENGSDNTPLSKPAPTTAHNNSTLVCVGCQQQPFIKQHSRSSSPPTPWQPSNTWQPNPHHNHTTVSTNNRQNPKPLSSTSTCCQWQRAMCSNPCITPCAECTWRNLCVCVLANRPSVTHISR